MNIHDPTTWTREFIALYNLWTPLDVHKELQALKKKSEAKRRWLDMAHPMPKKGAQ